MARAEARVGGTVWRVGTNAVDARFFETVGFEVTRGRGFYAHEAASRAPVAVVSEATARRLFPGESPLGRTIELETRRVEGEFRRHEVVGVAADVLNGFFFEGLDASVVYVPAGLSPAPPGDAHAASSGGPRNVLLRLARRSPDALARLAAACAEVGTFCEPFPLPKLLGQQRVPFWVASQVASSLGLWHWASPASACTAWSASPWCSAQGSSA